MRPATFRRILFALACACVIGDPSWAAKTSRTPITSSVKNLEMSPQELRIRVRALVRPTLGTIEQAADRMLRETSDAVARRGILRWKIETTTTILSAMLRSDPVLALADTWAYAIQVGMLMQRDDVKAQYGGFAQVALETMTSVEADLRSFVGGLQGQIPADTFERSVRTWAEQHPIEGAIYRRRSVDSAVAQVMAAASRGGAFAALGSLDETTSDVMTRMDLYTMYLPRLARWEAELAVDDLAGGVDPKAVAVELERFTRAADRIATVAEGASALVERERAAALDAVRGERLAATKDLQAERRAVLEALRQERIATLNEIEAIAERLLDRSADPFQAAVRGNLAELVEAVEKMRQRLIAEAGTELKVVVDHAFLRALELLVIAAVLGALGMVLHARYLRR